jgi:hypothetical protein
LTTTGFAVSVEEAKTIVRALDSSDHMTILQKDGINLSGVHFSFLRHGFNDVVA